MTDTRRERVYWICQLAGWSIFALSGMMMAASFESFSRQLVTSRLATSAIGLVVSHLFRIFVGRRQWVRLAAGSLIPRVLLAVIVMAIVWQAMAMVMLTAIFGFRFAPEILLGVSVTMTFTWAMALLGWAVIYFGAHYLEIYRRAEVEKWKLEAAVQEAELRALKSQMNPHFIFNCLNGLRALIVEDPPRAQEVVTQLANLLRYSLQSSNAETVTLEREMQTVADYLALEAIRLEDRLRVNLDIAPASLAATVPTMLVQTLVENGIKYGVANLPQGGEISVASRVVDSILQIEVTNSGNLGEPSNSTGVGLKNAAARLKLLFGEAASLKIVSRAPDRVTAEVSIPLAKPLS